MIKRILQTPCFAFSVIALSSLIALASAFAAEAFFLLEPCKLCIIQRYPFAIGLVIGLLGLALRNKKIAVYVLLPIGSLNFLVNSGVAVYHTGVEQHWWESSVDGCSVVFEEDTSGQSLLENIMSAPMGDCSKIPWQDPLLNLSMANWNIAFCLGLSIFCLIAFGFIRTRQEPSTES